MTTWGFLEEVLPIDAPEVTPARPEHRRHHVHGHLVHETGREDLTADLAGVHGDIPLPGELLGLADRRGNADRLEDRSPASALRVSVSISRPFRHQRGSFRHQRGSLSGDGVLAPIAVTAAVDSCQR